MPFTSQTEGRRGCVENAIPSISLPKNSNGSSGISLKSPNFKENKKRGMDKRKKPRIMKYPLFIGKNREKIRRIKQPIVDDMAVSRGMDKIING